MARFSPDRLPSRQLRSLAAVAMALSLVVSIAQMGLVRAAAVCEVKRPVVRVIRGQIVAAGTEEPLSKAEIVLKKEGWNGPVVGKLFTNDEGMFRFSEVPVGRYFLSAKAHGFTDFATEVQVSAFPSASRGILIGLNVGVTTGCNGILQTKDFPDSFFRRPR